MNILSKLNLIAKCLSVHFQEEKTLWISNRSKSIVSLIDLRFPGNKTFVKSENDANDTIDVFLDSKKIASMLTPNGAIQLFDDQTFNIYDFNVVAVPLKVGTNVKILRKTYCKESSCHISHLLDLDGNRTTDFILNPTGCLVKFDDFEYPQAYSLLDVEEI